MHREFAAFSSDNARVAAAFRFEAWEEVSGSRCLGFSIDFGRGTQREGKNYKRYWLDVNRGYHVLKCEHYLDGSWERPSAVTR